ncbi:unnamed protein product [Heligmosomoides polygyrus]|uniref:Endo/exonuclease/phosphatase domain-containing protein n=1 Tax=Heligmosomoides polygyrus TaxID=6339 RepID=A0A183GLL4_HELPZ|nr:unnamed protein product [Heligmosomoides polygyrus]
MRGSLMRGRHRGATELVRKSRNVSRTRVATLNVGTLTGRSCELVEALERRRVDLCAVQETRWFCRMSRDIGRGFKAVLCGSPRTTSGVGVIVSEGFRNSIVDDVMLDSEDKGELERELQAWCGRLERFGLKLNVKKTEYLTTDV